MTHAQIPSQLKEPKPVRETGSETTVSFQLSCHPLRWGVTQNLDRGRPAPAGSSPPRGNPAAAVAWQYSSHGAGSSQTCCSHTPVYTGTQPAFLKAPRSLLGSGDEQRVFDQRSRERTCSLLTWEPALKHKGAAHTPTRSFHGEARSRPVGCLLAPQRQPGCAPENVVWWPPASAAVWWVNSSRELPSGKINSLQLETGQLGAPRGKAH